MNTFFYIYDCSNRNGPRVRHPSLEAAIKEAERLAEQHVGRTFEVLQCVAVSKVKGATTEYAQGMKTAEETNGNEW